MSDEKYFFITFKMDGNEFFIGEEGGQVHACTDKEVAESYSEAYPMRAAWVGGFTIKELSEDEADALLVDDEKCIQGADFINPITGDQFYGYVVLNPVD